MRDLPGGELSGLLPKPPRLEQGGMPGLPPSPLPRHGTLLSLSGRQPGLLRNLLRPLLRLPGPLPGPDIKWNRLGAIGDYCDTCISHELFLFLPSVPCYNSRCRGIHTLAAGGEGSRTAGAAGSAGSLWWGCSGPFASGCQCEPGQPQWAQPSQKLHAGPGLGVWVWAGAQHGLGLAPSGVLLHTPLPPFIPSWLPGSPPPPQGRACLPHSHTKPQTEFG